jgi:D-alanyl-D-alanine carboxypeptidase (penicillin-binding protein 5/6)
VRGRRAAAAAATLLLMLLLAPAQCADADAYADSGPTYTYPPPAPTPTAQANSPEAPDPHPPAGGVAPDGSVPGGARLAGRGLVLPAGAPALPSDLTARAWVLVDLDSGDILAARDPHGRYQPASILKLLTSVTLIPRLPGDEVVTVTKSAADTEGSHAGIVAGGRYRVDDLFRGLLLVSGNDTAVALAQAAGGVPRAVGLMNRTALSLGAYDTYVQTPSGLDGWKQLTSAYDMALVLRAALRLPRFVAYERTLRAYLPFQPVVGRVELDNQNAEYLQHVSGSLVAKTGYTDAAQHTYVAAMQRGGRRLGVVFLRAQRYPIDQWQQAVRLFEWGYRLPAATPPVGRLAGPAAQPRSAASAHRISPVAATGAARDSAGTDRNTLLVLGGAALAVLLSAGWWSGRGRRPRGYR